MTLVAVWKVGDRLSAVADTRIGLDAGNRLTEHGPKILPLPISCSHPAASGQFEREVLRTSVGFAFAGSTLSALSTHALACTLCSNLIAVPDTPLPDLLEVAVGVASISLQYIRDVGQHRPQNARFAAIIFGHCPRLRRLRAFEIQPVIKIDQISMQVNEHDLDVVGNVAIIGTSVEELRERIGLRRERAEHVVIFDDAPIRALQGMIAEEVDDRVGGSIQQAWAHRTGFMPVATVMPAQGGGAFNVLGFNISDGFHIGAYQVGMFGRM